MHKQRFRVTKIPEVLNFSLFKRKTLTMHYLEGEVKLLITKKTLKNLGTSGFRNICHSLYRSSDSRSSTSKNN